MKEPKKWLRLNFIILESFWDSFNHPKYGNCYTFNSGVYGKEVIDKSLTKVMSIQSR